MDSEIPQTKINNSKKVLLLTFFISQFLAILSTRLYLIITDYPRIEFGEYHLAHVLWGGALMYIAFILNIFDFQKKKVIYILAGVGYGLFIDEVGKFITSSNDYFHFLALPIIVINVSLTLLFALSLVLIDEMAKRKKLKLEIKQPSADKRRG